MAQLGRIDLSPDHRDRIAAVLSMLKPEGNVDELGIGSVGDPFANQMFPGINTIQTRAKYFFLVPYLLYEYQRLPLAKRRKIRREKYLEMQEYEVMWKLADSYGHKEGTGVIGITKYKCYRRCQIDPCAGILFTQPKTLQTVAYARVAPIYGGSVKIGGLGQKRIGANTYNSSGSLKLTSPAAISKIKFPASLSGS